MITLYESILGTTKSGKTALVDLWLKEHLPDCYDQLTLKSDGKIYWTGNQEKTLNVRYDTYDELPDFIQFADDDDMRLRIGNGTYMTKLNNVSSFRGLPKKVKTCAFLLNSDTLPEFEITCGFIDVNITPATKRKGKIVVNFEGDNRRFRVRSFGYRPPKEFEEAFELHNVRAIDMVNDFHFGDEFSKRIARKTQMNKYKNKYEFPISKEGLEVVNTFFGKKTDVKGLEEISYTQNSKLVKHKGEWYRCKNWV